MRNYTIVAACIWSFLVLVVMLALVDDPAETVCIAAQSIDLDGTRSFDATRCFEVAP